MIVVWRLDRLGRNLRHLVNLVQDLNDRDIGIRVLAGQGASIDTTTASGKLVFALFAALAEFERELIRERTRAGLAAARARGRKGGRPHALSKAQVRLAQAAMAQRVTKVSQLCRELGVTKATIYRYVAPDGSLRNRGRQVLARQAVPTATLNVRFCPVTVGTPEPGTPTRACPGRSALYRQGFG